LILASLLHGKLLNKPRFIPGKPHIQMAKSCCGKIMCANRYQSGLATTWIWSCSTLSHFESGKTGKIFFLKILLTDRPMYDKVGRNVKEQATVRTQAYGANHQAGVLCFG